MRSTTPSSGGRKRKHVGAVVRFPFGRDGDHDDTLSHTSWPVISGSSAAPTICPVLPAGVGVWLLRELISPSVSTTAVLQNFTSIRICKYTLIKKHHYKWGMKKGRSWLDVVNICVAYVLNFMFRIPAGDGPMVIIQGNHCSMQRRHYVTSILF